MTNSRTQNDVNSIFCVHRASGESLIREYILNCVLKSFESISCYIIFNRFVVSNRGVFVATTHMSGMHVFSQTFFRDHPKFIGLEW